MICIAQVDCEQTEEHAGNVCMQLSSPTSPSSNTKVHTDIPTAFRRFFTWKYKLTS